MMNIVKINLKYFQLILQFQIKVITYVLLIQTMASFNAHKKKFIQQIQQKQNLSIPLNVQRISQKAFTQSFSMSSRFKNLQNPLQFIHNQHIEDLVHKTQQTKIKLRKQMDEVSEFSKSMYKKIISRDGNEFSFENIQQRSQKLLQTQQDSKTILYAQQKLRKTTPTEAIVQIQRQKKIKQQNFQKLKSLRQKKTYRHKMETLNDIKRQKTNQVDMTFEHIKSIDTAQFHNKCKNMQFYELLKPQRKEYHKIYNQPFDIDNNQYIQKLLDKFQLPLIEQHCQFSISSQRVNFDFDRNLRFWIQLGKTPNIGNSIQDAKVEKQKKNQEQILSQFFKFNKKQINVHNICDFAMRKINAQTLNLYFDFKKQHRAKIKMDKNNENLDQLYNDLKKEYQFAHQMRIKNKAQRIPVKFIDTQCQTIKILEQKQFDNYFSEDCKLIFEKLNILNKARQNAFKNKYSNKLVVIKNVCLQINEILFKLLMKMLEGEKFYPRDRQGLANSAPYFTYSDLLDLQNRQKVQRKVLQLIYTQINYFESQAVDGIPKSQIIQIYVQQRQKNNKIMELIAI